MNTKKIPDKVENPNGLHCKYQINKANGEPLSPDFEGFVLRLDENGDPAHIKASRAAVLTYADNIEPHIPKLAADLRERYA